MTEAPHLTNDRPGGDWADRMEQAVLDAAVERAPALGWNSRMVRAACEAHGLSLGDEELLFPNGARDLAALLSRRHDDRALASLAEVDPKSLKIRERIALQLAWETADLLWNWAGDTATDWNHYSKRAILSGILIPALTMRWFDGKEAADAFVARRIDNVMTFEKWKAGKDFDAPLRKMTDALSRMRYGPKETTTS